MRPYVIIAKVVNAALSNNSLGCKCGFMQRQSRLQMTLYVFQPKIVKVVSAALCSISPIADNITTSGNQSTFKTTRHLKITANHCKSLQCKLFKSTKNLICSKITFAIIIVNHFCNNKHMTYVYDCFPLHWRSARAITMPGCFPNHTESAIIKINDYLIMQMTSMSDETLSRCTA